MHTIVLCYVLLELYYQFLLDSYDLLTHVLQMLFTGIVELVWEPQYQRKS